MDIRTDRGSDRYSARDKREDRLIGVPTRQADRYVKSDESASRKTRTGLAGTTKRKSNRKLDKDLESGQTDKRAAENENKKGKGSTGNRF